MIDELSQENRKRQSAFPRAVASDYNLESSGAPAFVRRQEREAGDKSCRGRRNLPGLGSGFREPIPETEEGTDFPAFIPALLDFAGALIREAERVFVSSNGVDHRVGCFHQDVFPFWLFVRTLIQPKGCQLGYGWSVGS
jgi:hypothetical protein